MCPGFDSRTRRHMWIEFVVGSRPSSEGFSPGSPVFLPPQKSTFLNSNSIGNSRATGLSVEDCYVLPSLNKVNLFILFIKRLINQGIIGSSCWEYGCLALLKMSCFGGVSAQNNVLIKERFSWRKIYEVLVARHL